VAGFAFLFLTSINLPEGADGIIVANYLYKIAKPDGLTIGTFSRRIS